MTIEAVWRSAIRRIAQANDEAVAARVAAARDAIVRQQVSEKARQEISSGPCFPTELIRDSLGRHAEGDLDALQDYLLSLLWNKLRQEWRPSDQDAVGWGDDPFLGKSDLEVHLQARVPNLYTLPDVTAYIGSLGPPTDMGDLRSWLTKARKLYSNLELDISLLNGDIEELRFSDTAFAKVKNKHQLRETILGRSRLIPIDLHKWALIIRGQLATGSCDCPDSFAMPQTGYRAYKGAETRCRMQHFLSGANFDREEVSGSRFADELAFVERAVTGAATVYQHQSFAKSMFGIVFITPGGHRLRLQARPDPQTNKTVLVLIESDRAFNIDPADFEYLTD